MSVKQKKHAHGYSSSRGIVLIFVAGILTILAAIGMAFFAMTQSSIQSAVRYSDMVRSELLAQSGLHESVARLRQLTYLKTEDPSDHWYLYDWFDGASRRVSFQYGNGTDDDLDNIVDNEKEAKAPYTRALSSSVGDHSDRYTVEVEDASSKINVNACDNLAVVLDNLCRLIGPPLVAADQDLLQPRRWYVESGNALTAYGCNTTDEADLRDAYYQVDGSGRPVQRDQAPYQGLLSGLGKTTDGRAVYGDGYAVAGYRAQNGPFETLDELKNALTFVDRNGNGLRDDPLETLEVEIKFAALRPYLTTHSWVDTNTVCTGKFEWVDASAVIDIVRNVHDGSLEQSVNCQILIDREKSWVADKPVEDPLNQRGSLRGAYVSIINGHGAGQLRRILTNGTDWIALRSVSGNDERMVVPPGPISSYLIMAREDANLEAVPGTTPLVYLPKIKPNTRAELEDDPAIDYAVHPLCIHRAPVNINTASDKVLAALFMGVNVQHGHPMAVGTDADQLATEQDWTIDTASVYAATDPHRQERTLLTPRGLKRVPVSSGRLVLDRPSPDLSAPLAYLCNHGNANTSDFALATGVANEAHELAYRVLVARQKDAVLPFIDPQTGKATATSTGLRRDVFRNYTDFYFRVIKPWDDRRLEDSKDVSGNYHKTSVARMLMAQFNSNTDLLKFNPGIEWIDRWGRNFTELEPVMVYTSNPEPHNNPTVADPVVAGCVPIFTTAEARLKEYGRNQGAYVIRSFRYKSDELLDKTDLNRSTNEFSFDSNGIFNIVSTGQVIQPTTGQLLSERAVEAVVKVYDVWRESTQAEFVRGTISEALNQADDDDISKFAYAGKVVRDARNGWDDSTPPSYVKPKRLALDTLPEPLVPLTHRIANVHNQEVVASAVLDGYGRTKAIDVPDIVANGILPARYDGQIVLATNTARYNRAVDKDSFLASFNGDLDAEFSEANGREQAKTPNDAKVRVVDTIGLLGRLNDTEVDFDPGLPGNRKIFKFDSLDNALKPLKQDSYWNNVTVRMGDLRPEGAYIGGTGLSGKDATLKYLFGPNKENLKPDAPDGNCISMWMKPTWHHNDNRHHEFLNASNPANVASGSGWNSRGFFLCKPGRFWWATSDSDVVKDAGTSTGRSKNNDLLFDFEGVNSVAAPHDVDRDCEVALHGGTSRVTSTSPDEAPFFRIQPFRWHYLGARWRYNLNENPLPAIRQGAKGLWRTADALTNAVKKHLLKYYNRPFINTMRHADARNDAGNVLWKDDGFWTLECFSANSLDRPSDIGNTGAMNNLGKCGQDVNWDWADGNHGTQQKCFSLNNFNYDQTYYIYRHTPIDGTYAVIDEYKISSKDHILGGTPDWDNDRISREMTLSRYYLPPDPAQKDQCPTFTSQTLFQAKRNDVSGSSSERVAVARLSWSVFTPRFYHEYKWPTGAFTRTEKHTYNLATVQTEAVPFNGPFYYERYNDDLDTTVYSVNRPSPEVYAASLHKPHYNRGVEVELLDNGTVIPGFENSTGTFVATSVFTDPDVVNRFGTSDVPVSCRADQLRYRVRFLYPVDPLVDPTGGTTVNPAKHFLLDTPVFDDISITYFSKTRVLSYRQIAE